MLYNDYLSIINVWCFYTTISFFFKSHGDVWFIEDETGKWLPALIVFSESLKFLKQSLLEEANKQQAGIGVKYIKWILTVPAIWSDPAKAFMRRAAVGVLLSFMVYCKGEREREKKREREREFLWVALLSLFWMIITIFLYNIYNCRVKVRKWFNDYI